MTREIDITSPQAQRLLYGPDGAPQRLASGKRKLFQVSGDMDTGVATTTRLDRMKHQVMVFYRARDLWLTVDVYRIDGEPDKVHLICPRCEQSLQIPGHKKAIEFDPAAESPLVRTILAAPPPDWDAEDVAYLRARGARGKLSVEPFQCTWELKGSHELCRWKAAIDSNIAKDA